MQKTHVCDEDRNVGFDGQLLATPAGTFDRLPIREDEAIKGRAQPKLFDAAANLFQSAYTTATRTICDSKYS
jgi:hypothetical protein